MIWLNKEGLIGNEVDIAKSEGTFVLKGCIPGIPTYSVDYTYHPLHSTLPVSIFSTMKSLLHRFILLPGKGTSDRFPRVQPGEMLKNHYCRENWSKVVHSILMYSSEGQLVEISSQKSTTLDMYSNVLLLWSRFKLI